MGQLHIGMMRRIPCSPANPRTHRWRFGAAAFALACALLSASALPAQSPKHSDYEVKAAYLYNFGRFVHWPAVDSAASGDAFNICVLGEDPFGPTLDTALAGASIGNKGVVARRISGPHEVANCKILFLSSSEAGRVNKILESLDKSAVLTVSDMPQFSQRGGMIQFVMEENKVRFEVNMAAAQNAGLSFSSELLRVALAVRRNAHSAD